MNKATESRTYKLSRAISKKKEEMIELGMHYGLTDERTVRCSQQLDDLLNQYRRESTHNGEGYPVPDVSGW